MRIAEKHNIYVVEDAAQAVDSYYKGKPLGSIGHLGAFSFHETKNIISGEGGLLTINDDRFINRAEVIWEKGTNRSAFFKGEIDKYGWVDTGSSFLPSELIAAFLYAQLEHLNEIQEKRKGLWTAYYSGLEQLKEKGKIRLPEIPNYATNNAHMFYIIVNNIEERDGLIDYLKKNKVHAVFHYLSLHKSSYATQIFGEPKDLINSDIYSDCLVRLPLFYELEMEKVSYILSLLRNFFQ